ncbi:MAG: hypothetical protein LBB48_02250 [Treponema sp.]|jgi:hypothetical protein|nr:hypothetical protein [Treponema sp.]
MKTRNLYIALQSFGSDAGYQKTYVLKPLTNADGNRLLFREAAQNIEKVLAANGYAANENAPAFEIIVDYGVTSLTRQETREIGFLIHTKLAVHYVCGLTIAARGNGEEVWRVEVSTSCGSDNLRDLLPYLTVAAVQWIGKDSRKRIGLPIEIRDEFDMGWMIRLQKECTMLIKRTICRGRTP